MTPATYNQKHKDILDSMLLHISVVQPGKMFGYPAYYVGGKLFACVFQDAVGIKVPESMANELLKREDIVHFQPLGRKKMREWVQINHKISKEYTQEQEIFDASIEFVSSLAGLHIERKK